MALLPREAWLPFPTVTLVPKTGTMTLIPDVSRGSEEGTTPCLELGRKNADEKNCVGPLQASWEPPLRTAGGRRQQQRQQGLTSGPQARSVSGAELETLCLGRDVRAG